MSFAIFKGEKTIKELASRLFKLPAEAPKSATNQAVAALLAANPQLKNMSKVRVGTVLTIPPAAPPLHPAEHAPLPVSRASTIAQQAQNSVESIRRQLAEIDARVVEGANQFVALAQSKKMQGLVGKSKDLQQQFPALIESVKTTIQAMNSADAARQQNLGETTKALQTFARVKS